MAELQRMAYTSDEEEEDQPELHSRFINKHTQSSLVSKKRRACEYPSTSQDVPTKKRRFTESKAIPEGKRLLGKSREDNDQGDALFFEKRDRGENVRTRLKRRLERVLSAGSGFLNHVTSKFKPGFDEEATGIDERSIWSEKLRPIDDAPDTFVGRSKLFR